MSQLVQFDVEGGGSVLVRVSEELVGPAEGPVTRGGLRDRQDLTLRAAHTFDESVQAIQPAAEALLRTMTGLSNIPDQINVEFAVELSAQAGACIATLGTTANFKVSLTWHPTRAESRQQ